MMSKLKLAVVVAALFLSINVANGFWSFGVNMIAGGKVHQEITTDALSQLKFIEGVEKPLTFSMDAADKMNGASAALDIPNSLGGRYVAREHFDDESFASSVEYIKSKRVEVWDILSSADPWGLGSVPSFEYASVNQLRAWKFLGQALHTLQDFYSHSTWIEQGKREIIDIISADERGFFQELEDGLDITEVCVSEENERLIASGTAGVKTVVEVTQTPIAGEKITTGYYENKPDVSRMKCDHGDVIDTFNHCRDLSNMAGLTSLRVTRPGINKDNPNCYEGSAHRMQAILAKSLAIKETRVFVQSIIDDLALAGHIRGICALMGIAEVDCPEPPEEEPVVPIAEGDVIDSIYFVGLWFCSGNYSTDSDGQLDSFLTAFNFNSDGSGRDGRLDFQWAFESSGNNEPNGDALVNRGSIRIDVEPPGISPPYSYTLSPIFVRNSDPSQGQLDFTGFADPTLYYDIANSLVQLPSPLEGSVRISCNGRQNF